MPAEQGYFPAGRLQVLQGSTRAFSLTDCFPDPRDFEPLARLGSTNKHLPSYHIVRSEFRQSSASLRTSLVNLMAE
jgi:hypothetical protein